jgi:hypothetical protein
MFSSIWTKRRSHEKRPPIAADIRVALGLDPGECRVGTGGRIAWASFFPVC